MAASGTCSRGDACRFSHSSVGPEAAIANVNIAKDAKCSDCGRFVHPGLLCVKQLERHDVEQYRARGSRVPSQAYLTLRENARVAMVALQASDEYEPDAGEGVCPVSTVRLQNPYDYDGMPQWLRNVSLH